MNQRNLVLIGGGGHCKSVIDVAESAGYNILGILDMPEDIGKSVLDYKVIGTDDDIPQFVEKAEFIITVGFIKSPAIRMRLFDKVRVRNPINVIDEIEYLNKRYGIKEILDTSVYFPTGEWLSLFCETMTGVVDCDVNEEAVTYPS